ncbi:uncharacterized protein LOC122013752 [Zingiber officinale]|uniref:uncharacterized protein LOC122013752 n=1 Tax=Zingiber officinale TaxID=94328 RepID=UPI001C4D8039|nr:uncharacterized protein LOC122013752 [Zingiber officinale]
MVEHHGFYKLVASLQALFKSDIFPSPLALVFSRPNFSNKGGCGDFSADLRTVSSLATFIRRSQSLPVNLAQAYLRLPLAAVPAAHDRGPLLLAARCRGPPRLAAPSSSSSTPWVHCRLAEAEGLILMKRFACCRRRTKDFSLDFEDQDRLVEEGIGLRRISIRLSSTFFHVFV